MIGGALLHISPLSLLYTRLACGGDAIVMFDRYDAELWQLRRATNLTSGVK